MGNNSLMALRRLHGRLYDFWTDYREQKVNNRLVHKAIKATKNNFADRNPDNEAYPIDFVVTWVDGSDPDWLEQKTKFVGTNASSINTDDSRYREWDIFKYWFRAVEKYAPWVNKVYLVTWGHVPNWLNLQCPKLKIIRHEDIIPSEYLPTFSSHTIEWNIWRIPGLSEHFVYFNDDIFITKQLEKSDFFCGGLPKYCAIAEPIKSFENMNAHRHACINSCGIINDYFDIKECISNHPDKWFNYQYGELVKYNVRAYEDGFICGMKFSHLGVPFRRSAWEEFCNNFPESIRRTCMRRVRSSDDIMHLAVQMWEMFKGSFIPVSADYYGQVFFPLVNSIDYIITVLSNKDQRMICINDHEALSYNDFRIIESRIKAAFEELFTEKSMFEK